MPLSGLNNSKRGTLASAFFVIMLTEIFIGGAGRIFVLGSITARMIFFVIAIIYSFLLLVNYARFNALAVNLTLIYIILTVLAVITGVVNRTDPGNMVENVLMSSFFLTFPFFSLFIKTEADIDRVTNLFKKCALFLAVSYLLLIAVLLLKIIPFTVLYVFLSNPEFAFRSQSAFFYKGFLFMACGLFFYSSSKGGMSKYFCSFVILGATVATFVRGFIVSIAGCYLFYLTFVKNILWGLVFSVSLFLALPLVLDYYKSILSDRTSADQIRVTQFQEVMERTNPLSAVIGAGYGAGVPVRSNHFEINFLEIFYKQGLVGLFFWLTLLAIVIYKFFKARRKGYTQKALPFLLSCLFLYLQSASNPFLTNSMGMTIVFISILSLDILSQKKNHEVYA